MELWKHFKTNTNLIPPHLSEIILKLPVSLCVTVRVNSLWSLSTCWWTTQRFCWTRALIVSNVSTRSRNSWLLMSGQTSHRYFVWFNTVSQHWLGYITAVSCPGYITVVSHLGYITVVSHLGYITAVSHRGYITVVSHLGYITVVSHLGYITVVSHLGYITVVSSIKKF